MQGQGVVIVVYVILSLGGLSLTAEIDVATHCSPGWMYYGEACYLFSSREKDTWSEASSRCRALHSELADVTSDGENRFIKSEMTRLHLHDPAMRSTCYYLSGTDLEVEGQWMWASTDQTFTYTDWGPGEPNNAVSGHSTQNCLCCYGGFAYRWADTDCHRVSHFVCKRRYKSIHEPKKKSFEIK